MHRQTEVKIMRSLTWLETADTLLPDQRHRNAPEFFEAGCDTNISSEAGCDTTISSEAGCEAFTLSYGMDQTLTTAFPPP